ncbi:hypothetical protein [Fimbriiglobus ruber]|uniref:Uncharacterized protein n=1 Tax=Fimbriiglobus ruber TaxID=1908690 RepID=A0A225CY12_9BACT|nr:hypothetical protein [Fimbriiglobus ruber]OWK34260.1 hypothetical protein FRUB_10231 [Fimbriiglobus ruber]
MTLTALPASLTVFTIPTFNWSAVLALISQYASDPAGLFALIVADLTKLGDSPLPADVSALIGGGIAVYGAITSQNVAQILATIGTEGANAAKVLADFQALEGS